MGMTEQEHAVEDKPVKELAGDLAHQLTALLHDEVELAKVELTEKGKRAGLGAGMFAAAAALATAGLLCLCVAAIAALHLVLQLWLAALVIAAGALLLGGILARVGRSDVGKATPPVPSEAIEHAKEDVQWLRQQAKSARI